MGTAGDNVGFFSLQLIQQHRGPCQLPEVTVISLTPINTTLAPGCEDYQLPPHLLTIMTKLL